MVEQKVATYSTPYQFTGQELDVETGLYYYGARYYDPKVSLFVGGGSDGGEVSEPKFLFICL